AVQVFYDGGHSITECQIRFGFARKTFMDAAARGAIKTGPRTAPLDEYLVAGRLVNRTHLKGRLLAEGLKENRCECRGTTDWQGSHLAMALHHGLRAAGAVSAAPLWPPFPGGPPA